MDIVNGVVNGDVDVDGGNCDGYEVEGDGELVY